MATALSDVEKLFAGAVEHYRAGRFAEAEADYRRVLDIDKDHAESFHHLGLIAKAVGNMDAAVTLLEKSISLNPNNGQTLSNLSVVLLERGDGEAAEKAGARAVSLLPEFGLAHYNLANALAEQGRHEEACAAYARSLDINPDFAGAHNNLGGELVKLDRLPEAEASIKRALALDPGMIEGWNALGVLYKDLKQPASAEACFRKALDLDAGSVETLNNLGTLLHLGVDPDATGRIDDLSEKRLTWEAGRLEESIAYFRQALEIEPDNAELHAGIGGVLRAVGRLDQALTHLHRAVELSPESPLAHFNLAFALLLSGDLADGWREHEWRWKIPDRKKLWRDFPLPIWSGEDISDKNILVWMEQGVGDEVMFAGLLGDLAARSGGIRVECDARLIPLFERSFPGMTFVARRNPPDPAATAAADVHVAAGDLPCYLRQSFDAFPSAPYLRADEGLSKKMRRNYQAVFPGRRLIGVSWKSGNEAVGAKRSLGLVDWRNVLEAPRCGFVSLQYGKVKPVLGNLEAETGVHVLHDETVNPIADMDVFAAQVAAMDMVISVDNSTVHVAGALGVPTWVLLPHVPDWRWFLDRDDSPWYASLALFRQHKPGDWSDVISAIADGLKD